MNHHMEAQVLARQHGGAGGLHPALGDRALAHTPCGLQVLKTSLARAHLVLVLGWVRQQIPGSLQGGCRTCPAPLLLTGPLCLSPVNPGLTSEL